MHTVEQPLPTYFWKRTQVGCSIGSKAGLACLNAVAKGAVDFYCVAAFSGDGVFRLAVAGATTTIVECAHIGTVLSPNPKY